MIKEFGTLKKRLVELCRIAAPSRNERAVRDYLYTFWLERKDRGLSWQEAPASSIPSEGNTSNILMTLGTSTSWNGEQGGSPLEGKKPPVLLCAHMDTVPTAGTGEIAVLESDGLVHSDGKTILGGDDRAGIALALEMIDLFLAETDRQVSLEVLFTVQEELGCLGSRNTGFPKLKSALAYCLDGETSPPSIILRSPHKECFTCQVRGKTAHAALEAEQGKNAICRAAKLLLELPQGRIDQETTANIGNIHGGGQTNIVPNEVRFTGELRSFSESRFAGIKEEINAACERVNREEGYSALINWEHTYNGYTLGRDEEVVQRFLRSCAKKNIQPSLLSSLGGGDANNLNALGIKTVVFGIGMHKIHTPREYLVLEELFTAAELLRLVLSD